ncbi:hypothetical protein SAMN05444745_13610 [Arthrobacter sp. OV608]|nr:hypothetical protein SAMN05444745_13610 [Arthrobacter sp. OV608]
MPPQPRLSYGKRWFCLSSTVESGPAGCRHIAPGCQRHQLRQSPRSTGPSLALNTIAPGTRSARFASALPRVTMRGCARIDEPLGFAVEKLIPSVPNSTGQGPGQVPRFADRFRRNERGPKQPVCVQLGEPGRVRRPRFVTRMFIAALALTSITGSASSRSKKKGLPTIFGHLVSWTMTSAPREHILASELGRLVAQHSCAAPEATQTFTPPRAGLNTIPLLDAMRRSSTTTSLGAHFRWGICPGTRALIPGQPSGTLTASAEASAFPRH